jgi:hypothetical protein
MSVLGKKLDWFVFALTLLLASFAFAQSDMEKTFKSPPTEDRPWTYWWWLNSNVTREGITHDLEEMKRQGIQGVLIFNAGEANIPKGPKFLSPEWNDLFKFALSEATRLGMEASVSLCDGWDAGGPWIPADAANKKLTYSETQVDGPQLLSATLPTPPTVDDYYHEVAVLAIREKGPRPVQPAEIRASSAVNGYCNELNWPPDDLADGDPNTFWQASIAPMPNVPAWVDYVYSEPLTASAIFLAAAKDGGPKNCDLQTSNDGTFFETIHSWTMAQGESKRIEFPETKAKIFRLAIQSSYTPGIRLAEMWLLRKDDQPIIHPGIKWWKFKSGNRSFWDWPKEGPAVMEEEYAADGTYDCRSKEVVDLSTKMNKEGKLEWQAPEGRWTILRFGYTLEGQRTRCSSTVIGYEADMLDPLGIETHFKHCAEPLLNAAGEYAGKTLKYLHVDSYEIGADVQGQQPTWSAKFLDEFRARRGYDPLPYLPALTRRIVDDREKTDRFLWDIRMTIGDLMVERFFGRLAELAHARGVGIHCETGYGTYPHPQFDGLRAAGQNDVTMGEFWWGTDIMSQFAPYCNVIRSVASPAHVYGKKIVQAESFTTWSHFYEYPSALKPLGDEAFCDGLNRMVFHQYTHQSNEDQPGHQYFAGTHIDRHLTWWNMIQPFLMYLTRCQKILQDGRFHADVCYFYGEGTAKFVPGKKYLKPALPPGDNFDCVNADVLLNRMTVKDGLLVLPDGMSYRLLVLPEQRTMSPAVLKKIQELLEAGATVLGEKPLHTPGLTDWPQCDRELNAIAETLWGKNPAASGYKIHGKPTFLPEEVSSSLLKKGRNILGYGVLAWGIAPGEMLEYLNAPPDFSAPNDNQGFEFIHRILSGGDFYFISNQTGETRSGDFLFRIGDRKPELWDPVAGGIRNLPEFSITDDGRTKIPMRFAPAQSYFVVFPNRKDATPLSSGKGSEAKADSAKNFLTLEKVAELSGPWTVSFDPKWGGPEKIVFENLDEWTTRPEEGIKYYSGTAVYRKTFDLENDAIAALKQKRKLRLDLGKVNYLARVRLNGQDLGIVWTAPWEVDISDAVQSKGNELEIEVVNTWLNRLVGDAHLPVEKRLGKTNVQYPANQSLMPSGLLGPVTLKKQTDAK